MNSVFSVSENRSCRTTEISRARLSAKATPRADQPACSTATCSAVCVLSAAGTGDNKFSPSASTTRGMLMTVLARYAGQDTSSSTPWYQAGMDWAKANGVSDGTKPTGNITREQLVTMLYRYAGSPAADGKLDSFSDAASVSSYAVNAMQWAVANGIVNGSNDKLNPQNNATRAEVAAILMRFCERSK